MISEQTKDFVLAANKALLSGISKETFLMEYSKNNGLSISFVRSKLSGIVSKLKKSYTLEEDPVKKLRIFKIINKLSFPY